MKKVVTDDEFAKWADALKPCRYCGIKFVGPVCSCEHNKASTRRR